MKAFLLSTVPVPTWVFVLVGTIIVLAVLGVVNAIRGFRW